MVPAAAARRAGCGAAAAWALPPASVARVFGMLRIGRAGCRLSTICNTAMRQRRRAAGVALARSSSTAACIAALDWRTAPITAVVARGATRSNPQGASHDETQHWHLRGNRGRRRSPSRAAFGCCAGAALAQKTAADRLHRARDRPAQGVRRKASTRRIPNIELKWVRDSTGVITAKLLAEKANPQADVDHGRRRDQHRRVRQRRHAAALRAQGPRARSRRSTATPRTRRRGSAWTCGARRSASTRSRRRSRTCRSPRRGRT